MLGQVLGFVRSDEFGEKKGYFGLEQYYDGDLRGQNGWILREKNALGDPILWAGHDKIDAIDGSTLFLTIDRTIQFIAETELEAAVEKYSAKSGTIIISEPNTGKILAMANYPEFYPVEFKDENDHRNLAISNTYEPGSVVKALTMSAAIDLGKVSVNTVYNDLGPVTFSGHLVDNWDKKHHGEETMTEILQHSNNLGAAWVGRQVGDEKLMSYFRAFGFGEKTGIDLEGEEAGIMYKDPRLKDIELVNASFGQGISATPLQLTMAFSTIANGGDFFKPYIVEKISRNGETSEIKPTFVRNVLSEESAEIMNEMLTQAVAGGEAKFFVSKNYKVAGKTGTAQIAIQGGYDLSKTNATFIGYLPSYKNFVMLVKLEEPSTPSGYASETAVPLWMNVAEKLANYYGLAPDLKQHEETGKN
jgi:stage V sporulation protein D (sporulation-specific penicillin-binding protein)